MRRRNCFSAEAISVADACGKVDLLVAAGNMRHCERLTARLPKRLVQMGQKAEAKLRRTA